MLICFGVGFLLGAASSVLYLVFGPCTGWTPDPLWAKIVFFPGVFAGHKLYECLPPGGSLDLVVGTCEIVGVCVNGLVAGVLACGGVCSLDYVLSRGECDENATQSLQKRLNR